MSNTIKLTITHNNTPFSIIGEGCEQQIKI